MSLARLRPQAHTRRQLSHLVLPRRVQGVLLQRKDTALQQSALDSPGRPLHL